MRFGDFHVRLAVEAGAQEHLLPPLGAQELIERVVRIAGLELFDTTGHFEGEAASDPVVFVFKIPTAAVGGAGELPVAIDAAAIGVGPVAAIRVGGRAASLGVVAWIAERRCARDIAGGGDDAPTDAASIGLGDAATFDADDVSVPVPPDDGLEVRRGMGRDEDFRFLERRRRSIPSARRTKIRSAQQEQERKKGGHAVVSHAGRMLMVIA